MQVLQLCMGTVPRVIGVECFGKGPSGAAISWVEGHFFKSDIRKNRTRELCIMSHNEGLYPIIPRYISPFLIRRQLAAALAAAHYSLRIPSIHAICIDLIHYSMYCKDVLQTKYIHITPNDM